ncbi:MAG: hypothetical protein MAG458_01645 [Nitrosopumilus sp.]|nr:hypothetical protein [Nitrosopumilus sp.]
MVKLVLPAHLEDKIFEMKFNSNILSEIISYFPFNESEKQEIHLILKNNSFCFNSIFSDHITDEKWGETKEQIKKKFRDELFDIDTI